LRRKYFLIFKANGGHMSGLKLRELNSTLKCPKCPRCKTSKSVRANPLGKIYREKKVLVRKKIKHYYCIRCGCDFN
jgi:hypothetical protein